MAEPSKTPAPVEKKPPEYEKVMSDKRDAAAKAAYDNVSPLGKSIPPVEKKATGGKVQKVMQEFKSGSLKSSSGQKVTDPKQAIAIGLSEQRRMKGGGSVEKESKAMTGKEAAFMKKKGAPASMLKHEKAEMGMGMKKGGGIESRGKTQGTMIRMASGGSVSARADGIAQRGKTKFKNC